MQHNPAISTAVDASLESIPGPGSGAPRGQVSVQTLRARIRRYNSGLDPGSETFGAALVLVAGAEYGQNIDRLARRTGLDRAFVARCARRLIDNGVWEGGSTVAEWEPEDPASGTFWNDVAVAEGKMCRRARPDGTLEWAPAGYWNKNFHFLDPDAETRLGTHYMDSEPPLATAGEREPGSGSQPHAGPIDAAPDASRDLPGDPDPEGADAPVAEGNGLAGSVNREERAAEAPDAEPDTDLDPGQFVPSLHHVFRDAVWLG